MKKGGPLKLLDMSNEFGAFPEKLEFYKERIEYWILRVKA